MRKKRIIPILETKEQYYNHFLKDRVKLNENWISKNYLDIFKEIIKINHTTIFSEMTYSYLHNISETPHCYCDNKVKYYNFSSGYREYCSVKCSSNSPKKKSDIINTCLEKYGVKNIGEVTRDKALKTMIETYGKHYSSTNDFKNQYKETCLEKYGTEHYFQSDIFLEEMLEYRNTNEYKESNIDRINNILNTKKDNGLIYKWDTKEEKNIINYRNSVSIHTEKVYQEHINTLNPKGLERGLFSYHIDHIYPVIEGWKNNIDPKDIANINNLRLIHCKENWSKGNKTNMSIDGFYNSLK